MANAYDVHKILPEQNLDIPQVVQSLKFFQSAHGTLLAASQTIKHAAINVCKVTT